MSNLPERRKAYVWETFVNSTFPPPMEISFDRYPDCAEAFDCETRRHVPAKVIEIYYEVV